MSQKKQNEEVTTALEQARQELQRRLTEYKSKSWTWKEEQSFVLPIMVRIWLGLIEQTLPNAEGLVKETKDIVGCLDDETVSVESIRIIPDRFPRLVVFRPDNWDELVNAVSYISPGYDPESKLLVYGYSQKKGQLKFRDADGYFQAHKAQVSGDLPLFMFDMDMQGGLSSLR